MTPMKRRITRLIGLRRPAKPTASAVESKDEPRVSPTARVAAGAQVTDRATVGRDAVALGAVTVADHAILTEHAMLGGTAAARGRAVISGWSAVIERATVDGDAWVFGRAVVRGDASVAGHAQAFGDATVGGGAVVDGNAWVHGNATVTGDAWVTGRAQIGGHAVICGTATISGSLRIGGQTVVGDGAEITCRTDYEIHQTSWGETVTLYRCDDGGVGLGRSEKVHGPVALGRFHLPDARLSARVDELRELWDVDSALAPAHD